MGSQYRTNRATPALLPPAVPLGEGHANQRLHTQILDKVLVSTTADIAKDALTRSWSRRLSVSTRAASGREAVMSRSRGRAQVEVVIRGLGSANHVAAETPTSLTTVPIQACAAQRTRE